MRSRASRFGAIIAAGLLLAIVVAALVVVAGGSSGNGVASKSPAAIITAAEAAAAGLKSGHVDGAFGRVSSLNFDFVAGKGTSESISYKGGSMQFILIGSVLYEKGATLSSDVASSSHLAPSAAAELKGRWLQTPPADGDGGLDGFATSMRGVLAQFLAGHGALTKGATTTVDGVKVVAVNNRKLGWTLYVATSGKPYPIEMIGTAAHRARVVFDDFNAPISLSAPAHPVNLAKLEKGF